MKRIIFAAILILAQIPLFPQLPGNLKLYHIRSEHYDLIFPENIKDKAPAIAEFLDKTYKANAAVLKAHPRRLKVILNNQSAISNGYTALGPRYSLWYLTPYPQTSLGITEWSQLLAIHEMRHNIQYQALDRNFNKIMHILGGQYGLGGAISWSIPMWFYEGDAIFQEVILTKSGRGRSGSFAMPVKAITLEYPEKKLNYYKFFYRSYKTFYPNHYYLGYYLVTYINRHYGPQQWYPILDYSSKISFLPNAMNIALKKYTGLTYRNLFDSTMKELANLWIDTNHKYSYTKPFTPPHYHKRTFTHYYNPRYVNDSTLIFVKSSFDQINTLYLLNINTGEENELTYIPTKDFSYANETIAWCEYIPDIRWDEKSYSDIVILDLHKNKKYYLTRKGRYFGIDLSPDGTRIIAVEYSPELNTSLVLFDLKKKEVIKKYSFPEFNFIRYPRFTNDGKEIIFTATNNHGNGLFILNLKTGQKRTIIPCTYNYTISHPIQWKNYILFTSDFNKSPNIFAIDTSSKKQFQLSNLPYGATLSDINTKTQAAAFSNYTPDGFDIGIINLAKNHWKEINPDKPNTENYFLSDKTQNYLHDYTENFVSTQTYKIKPYNRLYHLINIHSWLPNLTFNSDTAITASINIYSNDVLQELSLNYSIDYMNTGQLSQSIGFTYRHFVPIIEFNFKQLRNWNTNTTLLSSNLNFSLPLNLSRYIWLRGLNLKEKNSFIYNPDNLSGIITNGFSATFYNYRQRSYRDPESRFGQVFAIDYDRSLLGHNSQVTAIGGFNFPGLLHHDLFKIRFSEQIITGNNIFGHKVSLPAGYSGIDYERIYKLRLLYHTPLVYPDWGWRPVFNIKRIRTKVFYDWAYIDFSSRYSSVGLQILADFNLFGFNLDFAAGIQFAYTIEGKKFNIAPIIENFPLN